jgi:hypothetical protein
MCFDAMPHGRSIFAAPIHRRASSTAVSAMNRDAAGIAMRPAHLLRPSFIPALVVRKEEAT